MKSNLMLIELHLPLNLRRRVRRKAWRDSGKYLMSPHEGMRNPAEANPASCYQYFIGSSMGNSMKFKEVKKELRDGGSIRREGWKIGQHLAKPRWLCGSCENLRLSDFSTYGPGCHIGGDNWNTKAQDMKATDWVVL